jgi:hypothetical protein
MAGLAPIVIDPLSCGQAYQAASAEPDRTPRHSIREVSEASGLSAHTLRWYERIGLLDWTRSTARTPVSAGTATRIWRGWRSSGGCG